MKKIEIEIPDDKRAEWVNGVLTLVDDKHVEFKFKIGDKVRFKTQHTFGHSIITQQIAYEGKSWYRLESIGELSEDCLEPYTEPQDITERIKTFEDACKWCNENGKTELVADYLGINYNYEKKLPDDVFAYLKLRIITCALNEGWEPTSKPNEKRWFVDFDINTKRAYFTDEINHVNMPFMLALRYEKLALYAGKQFKDIYMDFCFKPSQK